MSSQHAFTWSVAPGVSYRTLPLSVYIIAVQTTISLCRRNKLQVTEPFRIVSTLLSYTSQHMTFEHSFHSVEGVEHRLHVLQPPQERRHVRDAERLFADGATAGSIGSEGGDMALLNAATARVAESIATRVTTAQMSRLYRQ